MAQGRGGCTRRSRGEERWARVRGGPSGLELGGGFWGSPYRFTSHVGTTGSQKGH